MIRPIVMYWYQLQLGMTKVTIDKLRSIQNKAANIVSTRETPECWGSDIYSWLSIFTFNIHAWYIVIQNSTLFHRPEIMAYCSSHYLTRDTKEKLHIHLESRPYTWIVMWYSHYLKDSGDQYHLTSLLRYRGSCQLKVRFYYSNRTYQCERRDCDINASKMEANRTQFLFCACKLVTNVSNCCPMLTKAFSARRQAGRP